MPPKDDFNFPARPLSADVEDARRLLLEARAALFEMKRELAESKAHIKTVMNWDGDINDAAAVTKAKAEYTARLKTHVIDNADRPEAADLMKRMYGLYERMFPIADEREDFAKLLRVLQDNSNPAAQTEGAPFRQQWIVVEDEKGEIVAARYISTFSAARDAEVQKTAGGTQHLTYSFVEPKHRSFGLGDHTMKVAEEEGRKFIAATYGPDVSPKSINLLQFCEQNAPLRMTPSQLLEDTCGAKTDQFWRRDYYEKMGFREIDYAYTQIPLRPRDEGGESVDFLDLLVRARPGSLPPESNDNKKDLFAIAANAVAFHVYNTAKRSFAAGQYEVDADADWIKQAQDLGARDQLTIRPRLDFNTMKATVWNSIERQIQDPGFNRAVFENNKIGEIYGLKQIPPYTPPQPDPKVTDMKGSKYL